MPRDWHSAYLQQAKSDYAILKKMLQEKAPLCHRLHYLQMTTEKLAKGFLTKPGGNRYAKTHNAFVMFLIIARNSPEVKRACGFTRSNQFDAYLRGLLPLAVEIENLSPEGDDHPNPEYPWEANGVIYVPVEYSFQILDFKSAQVLKMLNFIDSCFEIV